MNNQDGVWYFIAIMFAVGVIATIGLMGYLAWQLFSLIF